MVTESDVTKAGKIGHAYLFAGSRGLGKTSVARIFAHAINKKRFNENDLYEIDAASNNSVDDWIALNAGSPVPATDAMTLKNG